MLLAAALCARNGLDGLPAADWERLIGQARRAGVLARLARNSLPGGADPLIPDRRLASQGMIGSEAAAIEASGPEPHLRAALLMAARRAEAVQVECERVADALAVAGHRTVLLKGAAYLLAGLPPARGRVFGDIDLLVPHEALAATEAALLGGGWISTEQDAYNQRYYRQWMHELPPLTHFKRGSVLDVHHTIVPPTSRFRVDGGQLLAAIRPAGPDPRFWVLQPVDMVLHSAVHLYTDGDFERGLRDLLDIRDLLHHFAADEADFWTRLLDRAEALQLQRPLWAVVSQAEAMLDVVPPALAAQRLAGWAPRGPSAWMLRLMLAEMLSPEPGGGPGPGRALLASAAYLRSHWLRMPLHLLLPHLLRKAWMARFSPATAAPAR